ncbi:molybdopterin-guanine dinucleotide biosynthesis protein B [Laceyella putida]|uniref:Molybdopterin-guanine dinucleotide biosynthesis protein B n=1 Tax=Laceyella putida TaxID=110101 RepID=A0ABW2RLU1_9BACL
MTRVSPPILQVVGYKNSGKTTLLCQLIHYAAKRGIRVGTVKHDGHDYEIDHRGTDTWRHRTAGAEVVAITSRTQTTLMKREPMSLPRIISHMTEMDLILVEGFKQAPFPKVVCLRREQDASLLDSLSHVIAIVTWFPFTHPTIPTRSIHDDPAELARTLYLMIGVEA